MRAVRVCRIDNVIYLGWVRAICGTARVEELHEIAKAIRPVSRAELRARMHRHMPVRQHNMLSKNYMVPCPEATRLRGDAVLTPQLRNPSRAEAPLLSSSRDVSQRSAQCPRLVALA